MSGFQGLSEDERWVLAFYVSNLASTEADLLRGAELWQSGHGTKLVPRPCQPCDANRQRCENHARR